MNKEMKIGLLLLALSLGTISAVQADTVPAPYGHIIGTVDSSNKATGQYATVTGGLDNVSSGDFATVIGGGNNEARGYASVVGGGKDNLASGWASVVMGGEANEASGEASLVMGGTKNKASGKYSVVTGGENNEASGEASVAAGGMGNLASGTYAVVMGGEGNVASGEASFAGGGSHNEASGAYASAFGGTDSYVRGAYSTGMAGGSTGENANGAVAIGAQSFVSASLPSYTGRGEAPENFGNAIALGYQSTASEAGTISFGHNAGDLGMGADGKTFRYGSAYYNRLVKIADGKDAHDAVAVEQLTQYTAGNLIRITDAGTNEKGQPVKIISLNTGIPEVTDRVSSVVSDIEKTGGRLNKVGAGAAALAALHPLDFDPEDKWNFAVGYGNYRDANAMALGAFYWPNADIQLSFGTDFGNGENAVRAGIGFKVGQGASGTRGLSRTQMEETLRTMKAQHEAQEQEITSRRARIAVRNERITKLESLVAQLENK